MMIINNSIVESRRRMEEEKNENLGMRMRSSSTAGNNKSKADEDTALSTHFLKISPKVAHFKTFFKNEKNHLCFDYKKGRVLVKVSC